MKTLKEWRFEIAEKLGIKPDSVYMRLARGLHPEIKIVKFSHQRQFVKERNKPVSPRRKTGGRQLSRLVLKQFTPGQRSLIKKHGTVSDFAIACHMCVPSDISYDEAEAAIQKYRREFNAA